MTPEIKNHVTAVFWIIVAVIIGLLIYLLDQTRQYFIAYLGFILALFVFFVVDYFRRPNFIICLGAINESPDGNFRFVHVNAINLDWPKWFFLFRRDAALNTTAEIIFKGKNSNKPFFSIPGRWSSNPEPIKIDSVIGKAIFDVEKARMGGLINISPSENSRMLREGKLGIAIKFEGENACYGFSDISYRHDFKVPAWKLERGVYDIEIIIRSGRFSSSRSFVLENLGKELAKLILKEPEVC